MPSEPVRLLLIDEDPQDRRLALRSIEPAFPGIEVTEVVDSASFARALEDACDIALIESQLLWTDGIRAFRLLRKRHPYLAVIMITESGDEEICARAMRAGFADYILKKPSGYARLPKAIRSAMSRARTRQRKDIVRSLEKRAFADVVAKVREFEHELSSRRNGRNRNAPVRPRA